MKNILLSFLISVFFLYSFALAVDLDPALKNYAKEQSVSGNLNSIGSDTLNNLMTLWTEEFKKIQPNVNIQVEGKGSSTAPPALISGTAQLAPMSRQMKNTEIDEFESKFSYKPTEIKVAVDALAVFVHKDNPIKGLSLAQVDAIFSKTRNLGAQSEIKTWGELGLTGDWASKPISIYGRNSASGTYGFFKQAALGDGDFKDTVKEQPGSASVVQSVSVDKYSIGYSGIGYATAGVKAVAISSSDADFIEPSQETAFNGTYPLARFLLVYINRKPNETLQPLTKEFLKLVLSKEGQQVVIKDGYYPLDANTAKEELSKIN
jgi:phosphate transport system substrate-binding protein